MHEIDKRTRIPVWRPRDLFAERTIAERLDLRCGLWSAEWIQFLFCQRKRLLDGVVHQISTDSIILDPGAEQDHRIFNSVCGKNDDFPGRILFCRHYISAVLP